MPLKKPLKSHNLDKMQSNEVQCQLSSKKTMADVRKEKIILSFIEQQQKRSMNISNNEVRRPKSGEQVPNIEKLNILRRRSNFRPFQVDPKKCYCNRPRTDVWCVMCGYLTKGNVRVTCPLHPNNFNIFEIIVCPNPKCLAPNHLNEADLKLC